MKENITLGDIATIQTGPFGSQLHASDYVENGIPVIMPTNIGNNLNIEVDAIAKINEADLYRLSKYQVYEDDIVYSRRGDVERCAFVTKSQNNWLCGTGCLRVRFKKGDIVPKFFAYQLSTDEAKGWISGHAVGSTMPNLNSSILAQVPLFKPGVEEQRAIAAVLSNLDDKIELLQRQNATLENMAEALFKQWFVVEAKEDCPDGVLGDILQLMYGKTLKEDVRSGTGYPVVGSSGIIGYHDKFLVKTPGIVIGRKGTIGNVILVNEPFYPIDTTFYIESRCKINTLFYLYFLLKSVDLKGLNTDSAVPGLNRNIAHGISIKIAPIEKIKQFEEQVTPFFNKINQNKTQIRTLETLRDTLLPRLMSGEVRVAH